jgi:hypothetical protein
VRRESRSDDILGVLVSFMCDTPRRLDPAGTRYRPPDV